MRQKAIDYLEKPDKKVWAKLTTMERDWINREKGEKGDAPKAAPKTAAKPAPKPSAKS